MQYQTGCLRPRLLCQLSQVPFADLGGGVTGVGGPIIIIIAQGVKMSVDGCNSREVGIIYFILNLM